MDYYIFRHGETFFSKTNTPYGEKTETAEILTEGIPAIEKLAEYLKDIKTDANYSSTYLRCRQTVKIVSKVSGKEFEFDERLRDYYEGRDSIEDVGERIESFLKSVSEKNYKAIAICTHGYPIAILKSLITKGVFEPNDLDKYPHPGILLEIKNGKANYIDFN